MVGSLVRLFVWLFLVVVSTVIVVIVVIVVFVVGRLVGVIGFDALFRDSVCVDKALGSFGKGPRAADSKTCVPSRSKTCTQRPNGRGAKNAVIRSENRGEKRGKQPQLKRQT